MSAALTQLGYTVASESFFDTVKVSTGADTQSVAIHLLRAGYNVRNIDNEGLYAFASCPYLC